VHGHNNQSALVMMILVAFSFSLPFSSPEKKKGKEKKRKDSRKDDNKLTASLLVISLA